MKKAIRILTFLVLLATCASCTKDVVLDMGVPIEGEAHFKLVDEAGNGIHLEEASLKDLDVASINKDKTIESKEVIIRQYKDATILIVSRGELTTFMAHSCEYRECEFGLKVFDNIYDLKLALHAKKEHERPVYSLYINGELSEEVAHDSGPVHILTIK